MTIKLARYSRIAVCAAAAYLVPGLWALDPHKSLTQYSRQVWSQQDNGLPEDNIKSIAQTSDGYLWLGTDEGLARFDGYDFVVFRKEAGGDVKTDCALSLVFSFVSILRTDPFTYGIALDSVMRRNHL